MSKRYSDDYRSAREEAKWKTLQIKFYASVVLGSVFVVMLLTGSVLLGVFVDPGAFASILFGLIFIMVPAFGYSEYGEDFYTERILRKRDRAQRKAREQSAQEISLEEAERIVAAFVAKGK